VLIRTFACLLVLGFTLGVTGCGDDEDSGDGAATEAPSAEIVTTEGSGTAELPPSTETAPDEEASPEDQEGGAGDEEAARSEVVLEFTRDGLEPPIVRVAPFIAVALIVRSDGTEYDIAVSGPRSAGGANGTTETDIDLDGLRPGEKYEVRERNTGSVTAIVAGDDAGP
jgi:hypothetical protein